MVGNHSKMVPGYAPACCSGCSVCAVCLLCLCCMLAVSVYATLAVLGAVSIQDVYLLSVAGREDFSRAC